MQPSRCKLSELIQLLQGTKREHNEIFDYTIVKSTSKFSGPYLKPTIRILKLSFFLHIFCLIHFNFIILLPEGRAGEAWEPSKRINFIYSPPPPLLSLVFKDLKRSKQFVHNFV
jgi:hypothetical protein